MAYKDYAIADFGQQSYFEAHAWRDNSQMYGTYYTSPSSITHTKSVTVTGIPTGSTITGATINFTVTTGNYGGTHTPTNGSSVSATMGETTYIDFYWKSNTGGSFPPIPNTQGADVHYDKTGQLNYTGMYVRVTYDEPTPRSNTTVTQVTVNGVSGATNVTGGSNVSISWTSADGTNNPITSHTVNGVTATTKPFVVAGPAVGATATYTVVAVGTYGSGSLTSGLVTGVPSTGFWMNIPGATGWKSGQAWIKVAGSWRAGEIWVKVPGSGWKKGIL